MIFTHTGQDQMIEGAKFIGGIYITDDETKIKSIKASRMYGKTIFELKKDEVIKPSIANEKKHVAHSGMKTTVNKG